MKEVAEKKNLCAPISIELHQKVREEQERLGQYVEQVLISAAGRR